MNVAIAALLLLVGFLNLAPVVGVLGAGRLQSLYGVGVRDPQLAILLRHRALLFGIVGGLLVAAAFRAELRRAAIAAGLVSMLGFIAIARLEGGAHGPLAKIAAADWLGSAALMAALVLELARRAAPATGAP